MLNKEVVNKWITKYPVLINFMDAGTISLKMAREILGVDRYFMFDMFQEFLTSGAVTATGTNSWRATPELKAYLKEIREENRHVNNT